MATLPTSLLPSGSDPAHTDSEYNMYNEWDDMDMEALYTLVSQVQEAQVRIARGPESPAFLRLILVGLNPGVNVLVTDVLRLKYVMVYTASPPGCVFSLSLSPRRHPS